jgi:TorA maturation chaperone TorD
MKEADEKLLELVESESIREFFPNFLEWDIYKNSDRTNLIEEHLNVDFADVSLLHLTPYESFYIRDDAMIDSGGDNKALQFYDKFDFIVAKDIARVVSPDHIAIEMEFVYEMIKAEKKALDDENIKVADEIKELQLEFVKNHLASWAPIYLINVINEASTPFYHDAAMTSLDFILGDLEYLNEQCKS